MHNSIWDSPPQSFPPRELWVLGAGHFGFLAVKRLQRLIEPAGMLVVDHQEHRLARIGKELEVKTHKADAVSFLLDNPPGDFVWLVPAVPIHLAFRWILFLLNSAGNAHGVPVSSAVDSQVPNPHRTETGTVYTSFADFLCPDGCNEPDDFCTHTRGPRPGNLFEVLAEMQIPGASVSVLRSQQLAPGVGGYAARVIRDMLGK